MIFGIEEYFIAYTSGRLHDVLLPLIFLGLNHMTHTTGQPASPQEGRQPECLVIPFALETFVTQIQGLDCEQICEGFHQDLSYTLQNQGMHTYIDICQSSKLVVLQNHGGKEISSTAEQETRDVPSAADNIHDQCFCLLTLYIVAYSGSRDSPRPWFARDCSPEDIASRLSGSFADESASWIARPFRPHSIMPIACHLEIRGPLANLRPVSPYSLMQSRLPIEIMGIVNGRQRIELWEIVPDIESIMAQYVRESRIDPHEQNHVGIDLTSSALGLPLASMEDIAAHGRTGLQHLQQGGISAAVVSSNTSPDFANIGTLSAITAQPRGSSPNQANDEAESSASGEQRYRGLEFDVQTNSWKAWTGEAMQIDTMFGTNRFSFL